MSEDVQGQAAEESESSESSEATIAVHWREEGYFPPPPKFIGQANASDPAILDRFAEENFPECFREYADLLHWDEYWHTTLDTSNPPFWKWFVGGKLNASYNCVDRHLARDRNKAALIWVPEPEDAGDTVITYQELYRRVNEFAAVLRDLGLQAGDRVTLHMPMVPELPVTMLACARLGVVHSQVFAGFSGGACGGRIADSGSKILITMDGYYRSGDLLDHKVKADEAVEAARKEGQEIDKVLVWRRFPGQYSAKTPMVEGRDVFVDDLLAEHKGAVVEPVSMPAEAPLFLMYTSGTTGRPKGCQHSTGGYLSYVAGTSKFYQDIHPDDTYWCMADIGWITGHSYIVYGPLALGTTTVLYEGTPNYPDAGRPWRIAERLGVNIFHTSPTAIRMLRKVGPDEPAKYDYHFKAHDHGRRADRARGLPLVLQHRRQGRGDHRRHLVADRDRRLHRHRAARPVRHEAGQLRPGRARHLPRRSSTRTATRSPRAAARPATSSPATRGPASSRPSGASPSGSCPPTSPSTTRTRTARTGTTGPYFAGDGAVQAEDGYFRILGRVDDVINVAGHRLGTKELESSALAVEEVAEAAAVPVIDDVRGRAVEMYISLKPGYSDSSDVEAKVKAAIETDIGKIARPKNIWIVPDMPKTRSGKIMRRVIAATSNFADVGDITTLANPEVVEQIRHQVQNAKHAKGEVPRELTEAEEAEIKSFGTE